MEHFIVKFDPEDIRDVLLDGMRYGQTETALMADTDDYIVTLSGTGYTPTSQDVLINGTTTENPCVIQFQKTGAG
jgi:hypothetical protein